MPDDPFIAAAREILGRSLEDMGRAIEGLDAATLNRRPGGEDTNSLAVLVTHTLGSTRMWLSVAMGTPPPQRDRDAEFRAETGDPATLRSMIDELGAQCVALLDAAPADWTAVRQSRRGRPGASEDVTAAWALQHALEHLREHVGQMMLTRQVLGEETNGS